MEKYKYDKGIYSYGEIYYIKILDRLYVRIYDKKDISCLYCPILKHTLNLELGDRVCTWTLGFPSQEDMETWYMLNSKDKTRLESHYQAIKKFLSNSDRSKEDLE